MEIKITTNQILKILQVLSWIIFLGLCVEAGSIICIALYKFFINPTSTYNSLEGIDLSAIYKFDHGYFLVTALVMAIIAVLKAIMFYVIVKLFVDKKLNIAQPFSTDLRHFILKLSYLALGIGLFTECGFNYSMWLSQQGVTMVNLQLLHFAGADVWLFMAVILFVIVQIVKRGIEIQNENDLTI